MVKPERSKALRAAGRAQKGPWFLQGPLFLYAFQIERAEDLPAQH